jgi:hypothetical protein
VFRETVLAIVRERYSDFGPTLGAEKLSELHGVDLGVETLQQWMIDAGLWVRRKGPDSHQSQPPHKIRDGPQQCPLKLLCQ